MRLIDQLASILGAVFILAGYVALQRGRLSRESRAFNAMNLVGSLLLTYSAIRTWNVGFIILEGSWALLSLPGTIRPQQVA
jgi:predicted small integral membrane protein